MDESFEIISSRKSNQAQEGRIFDIVFQDKEEFDDSPMYRKIMSKIPVLTESGEIELMDWKDTPQGRTFTRALYVQLYKNHGKLPTDKEYVPLSEDELQQRKELLCERMQILLMGIDRDPDASTLTLVGETINAFSYGKDVITGNPVLGQVTADDLAEVLDMRGKNSYEERFLYMQTICALQQHCPLIENQLFEDALYQGAVPEEWQLLHLDLRVSEGRDVCEAEAQIKARVNRDQEYSQAEALRKELMRYLGIKSIDQELLDKILDLQQQIYAYVAAKMGYTVDTAPYLAMMYDEDGVTTTAVVKDPEGYYAYAGYVLLPNDDEINQTVAVYTAPLVADIERYFRGELPMEELINFWTVNFSHELHHARAGKIFPRYNAFHQKYLSYVTTSENYRYTPTETAAYNWGENARDNVKYPQHITHAY